MWSKVNHLTNISREFVTNQILSDRLVHQIVSTHLTYISTDSVRQIGSPDWDNNNLPTRLWQQIVWLNRFWTIWKCSKLKTMKYADRLGHQIGMITIWCSKSARFCKLIDITRLSRQIWFHQIGQQIVTNRVSFPIWPQ